MKQSTLLFILMAIFAAAFSVCGTTYAQTKKLAKPAFASVQMESSTIHLSWEKTEGAKKYEVYVQKGNVGKWIYWKSVKKTENNKEKYSKGINSKVKSSGSKYRVYKRTIPYQFIRSTKATTINYQGEAGKSYHFILRAVGANKVLDSKAIKVKISSNEQIVPKYVNGRWDSKTDTVGTANKQLLSEYIYADRPVLIYSKEESSVKVGVHVFDSGKNFEKSYSAGSVSKVTIPSGYFFKVYITTKSKIKPTDSRIYHAMIQRITDNVSYIDFQKESNLYVSTSDSVGITERLYAKDSLILHCSDMENYFYRVAYYLDNQQTKPVFLSERENDLQDYLIPKGVYYQYCVGPKSGEASREDIEKISYVSHTEPEKRVEIEVDEDSVPNYYSNYLDERIGTINGKSKSDGIQFAFITDYHYGTYRQTHNARTLLTKIVKETPVDIIFNGGDTWTSGTRSVLDISEAKRRLFEGVRETIPGAPCNWFFVQGNHDTGLDYTVKDGNVIAYGPYLTASDIRDTIGRNITDYQVIYDVAGKFLTYYVDIGDFRFIVTNPGLSNVGSEESAEDTYLFMAQALISMGDKTGVVISHLYNKTDSYDVNPIALEVGRIISAYNTRDRYTLKGTQELDFSRSSGEVAIWIAGHKHEDLSYQLDDGTPVMVTTTCNSGGELGVLERTVGTVKENAFDVVSIDAKNKEIDVTRVGAGNDRYFRY